jgi:hypothetical protein
MSDHGLHFAMSLHQMSDDLQEMAANVERGRKHWKHTGLSSEQRLQDAEAAMGKAKSKYDMLAEHYDRARTGDRQSGRFALKTKSAAQQEEDLNRKVQAADADYASKVQAARASRQELINSLRPQAVRALTELATECDSGLTLQLQKFASLNEKLLLGNGLCVSPLKNQPSGMVSSGRSLREVAHNIDNEKDFRDYILSFSNKAGTRASDIKYEKHPALASPKQGPLPSQPPQQSFNTPTNAPQNHIPIASNPPVGYERGHRPSQSGQISGVTHYQPQNRDSYPVHGQPNQYPGGTLPPAHSQPPHYLGAQIPDIPPHSPITMPGTNPDRPDVSPSNPTPKFGSPDRMASGPSSGPGPDMSNTQLPPNFGGSDRMRSGSGSGPSPGMINTQLPPSFGASDRMRSDSGSGPGPVMNNASMPPNFGASGRVGSGSGSGPGPTMNNTNQYREDFQSRPPQAPYDSFRSASKSHSSPENFGPNVNQQPLPGANIGQPRRDDGPRPDLPPLYPVFGVTLDELFRRDGTAVPSIVHQCTTAVELFGLDVEGIYRTSGSNPHIMEMKAMFDNGKSYNSLHHPHKN